MSLSDTRTHFVNTNMILARVWRTPICLTSEWHSRWKVVVVLTLCVYDDMFVRYPLASCLTRLYLAVLVIDMFGGYYVDQRQRFSLVLDCHPDLEKVCAYPAPSSSRFNDARSQV